MSDSIDQNQALEAVIARCAEQVRRLAWRYGLEDRVDEVFQEVRIRLWKSDAGHGNLATLCDRWRGPGLSVARVKLVGFFLESCFGYRINFDTLVRYAPPATTSPRSQGKRHGPS